MGKYLFGVIARSLRQFFFFIGRFLVLGLLLIFVSSGIRGSGSAVLGNLYYHLVIPGVVCHETAHAAACLCTGVKIVEFAPFKPHGDVLGYVRWDPGRVTLWTYIAAFLIGTAPLWLGCILVCFICKLLTKTQLLPERCPIGVYMPFVSGIAYWKQVAGYSLFLTKSMLKTWNFTSILNILLFYLLFCIISEMPPSIPDLQTGYPGIILLAVAVVCLNLIPFIGTKIDLLTIRLQPLFFKVHSLIIFVLLLDFLLFLCVTLPLSLLF